MCPKCGAASSAHFHSLRMKTTNTVSPQSPVICHVAKLRYSTPLGTPPKPSHPLHVHVVSMNRVPCLGKWPPYQKTFPNTRR